jgi:zinc resistance-associated protein
LLQRFSTVTNKNLVEEFMWKPVIGATAALVIAGSSLVYAQQRSGPSGFERGSQLSADDIAAMADARIAALKTGLRLTPDQDKNWPAFEQSLRDLAKLRAERMVAFRQRSQEGRDRGERSERDGDRSANPFERLQRRADSMTRFSAALKRMADTGAPLYQSLDDSQKHRFMMLAHLLRPRQMMGMRGERGGWFHRGGGQEGSEGRRGDGGRENWRRGRDGGSRGMDREPNEL